MNPLTDRQREVFGLLGGGNNLRQIGDAMGIRSTNGVNDHVLALVRKGMLRAAKGKFRPNRYELAGAGLAELGLACCPECRGLGTVPS
jgi:repressor LexA